MSRAELLGLESASQSESPLLDHAASSAAPKPREPFRLSHAIRALHVIDGENYSGPERAQDLLAKQLRANGVTVEFACVHPHLFPGARQFHEIPTHRVWTASNLDPRPSLALAGLALQRGADVLHAHSPRAAMVTAFASLLCRRPWVYHAHERPQVMPHPALDWLNRQVDGWVFRQAHSVIAVSDQMQRCMRSYGVKISRLHVVPNGVPCRDPFAVPDRTSDGWTLGTVGRHRPGQGLEDLLEAVLLLNEAGNDVRLRVVGPFMHRRYQESVRAFVEELGIEERVVFTGFRHDMQSEYAQMDAFVSPRPNTNGMSMALLEALSYGLPVVAARSKSVAQVLERDEHGLVTQPDDPADLATKLQRLFSTPDLYPTLARGGRARQQAAFSDFEMADGVAQVYDCMIQLGQIRT